MPDAITADDLSASEPSTQFVLLLAEWLSFLTLEWHSTRTHSLSLTDKVGRDDRGAKEGRRQDMLVVVLFQTALNLQCAMFLLSMSQRGHAATTG